MNTLKLTSPLTKVGLVISMIFVLAMIPVLVFVGQHQEFHVGMIIGGLMLVILAGIVLNLLIFNADAKIEGDQIHLKKMFSSQKSYYPNEIAEVKSMMVKRTKYTTVKFKRDNKTDKFLLINKIGLVSVSNKDSEAILRAIWQQ